MSYSTQGSYLAYCQVRWSPSYPQSDASPVGRLGTRGIERIVLVDLLNEILRGSLPHTRAVFEAHPCWTRMGFIDTGLVLRAEVRGSHIAGPAKPLPFGAMGRR
jgi:hypothetical protein